MLFGISASPVEHFFGAFNTRDEKLSEIGRPSCANTEAWSNKCAQQFAIRNQTEYADQGESTGRPVGGIPGSIIHFDAVE